MGSKCSIDDCIFSEDELTNFTDFDGRYKVVGCVKYTNTGKIYRLLDTYHQTHVIMKKFDCIRIPSLTSDIILQEYENSKKLDYPSFVRLFEYKTLNENIYHIQENYSGTVNLVDYVYNNDLSLFKIYQISKYLAKSLYFLHANGLVHGYICPENILIIDVNKLYDFNDMKDAEFYRMFKVKEDKRKGSKPPVGEHKYYHNMIYLKIIGLRHLKFIKIKCNANLLTEDLDIKVLTTDEEIFEEELIKGQPGNMFYSAPEAIEGSGYSQKVDVFAYGVLLFWMLTGTYPYDTLTKIGLSEMKGGLKKTENITRLRNKTPPKLVDMIMACLEPNPKNRIDFKSILYNINKQDSWFDEMYKISYIQLKPKVLKEELEYKKFIDQLLNIKFSNRLCRIVYFFICERYFNPEKMLMVGRLFMDMDAEGRGRINPKSVQKYLNRFYSDQDAIRYRDKIFSNIDVNNSYTIEYGEFRICGMEIEYEFMYNKLQVMFKLIDRDESKGISVDAIIAAVNDGSDYFNNFDFNGTSSKQEILIERNEYLNMCRQLLIDIKRYSKQGSYESHDSHDSHEGNDYY